MQRPTKLVKYLYKFGWEPIVLTAAENDFIERDDQLFEGIDKELKIIRVGSPISKKMTFKVRKKYNTKLPIEESQNGSISIINRFLKLARNLLMMPDSQIFWAIKAGFKLKGLLKGHEPDVIMATNPPSSAFILAYFSKLILKKPIILDYRDPWSQLYEVRRTNEPFYRKKIEHLLERFLVRQSDYIIGTTKTINDFLMSMTKNRQKVKLIYNGFDEEDFKNVSPVSGSKFTILYTGKCLASQYPVVPVMEAISILLKKDDSLKNMFEVVFIGLFDDPQAKNLISERQLQNHVKILGHKPHHECIARQLGAELLLLLQTDHLLISAKVFEYLRSGKKILAVVPPDSELADLLRTFGCTSIVSPDDPHAIAVELQNHIKGINSDKLNKRRLTFNRESQAKQFASILDMVIDKE